MQQLITRSRQLAELLPLTAAARQAFEIRRRMAADVPAYQVTRCERGAFRFQIVHSASGRVMGMRRTHGEAIQFAIDLESRVRSV